MGRKKSILFGSIFVLALLLLMPSIPAIQQKTIEDKIYSDFKNIEILKYSDFPKQNNFINFLLELLDLIIGFITQFIMVQKFDSDCW